jgi:hypothetical protein
LFRGFVIHDYLRFAAVRRGKSVLGFYFGILLDCKNRNLRIDS